MLTERRRLACRSSPTAASRQRDRSTVLVRLLDCTSTARTSRSTTRQAAAHARFRMEHHCGGSASSGISGWRRSSGPQWQRGVIGHPARVGSVLSVRQDPAGFRVGPGTPEPGSPRVLRARRRATIVTRPVALGERQEVVGIPEEVPPSLGVGASRHVHSSGQQGDPNASERQGGA